MKRIFLATAMALLGAAISVAPVWAQRGGGGRGGGGGFRGGGGASFRGGGGGMGGGFRAPAIRSGGGVRALGGTNMRAAPSMRSAPSIRQAPSVRSNANIGLGARGNAGSPRINPSPSLGSRVQGNAGVLGRSGMGQSGIGVRPNVSGLGSRINVPGVGTRLNLSGAGAGGSTNLGARTFAGRVTSGQINNHLSLGARQGALGQGNLGQINRGQGILGLNGGIRASSGANLKASLPNWVNVRSSQIGRVNNNLGAALRSPAVRNQGLNNWLVNNPARATHWNNWAGNVRGGWRPNWYHGYFNNHFWAIHASPYAWRRGAYWWGHRPWGYWWGVPTWGAYQAWWPQGGRSSPCYYDYGPGGNVVYSSGYVYVSGQPVGTVADYAASAVALADVPEPANPDQATEWLPLGTFALATSQEDRDPTRIIQLAVDREGIISGTYLNRETDKTYSVQGRVDRQTQRVAFTIGDNRDAVFETGIYNLTQAETPILIHDGPDQTETYLLIRLEAPKETEPRPPAPGDAGLLP